MTATGTTTDITTTVTEIVTDALGVDTVAPDTDLRAVEGADSVKLLRILARIEERYDIELEDADVFGVSTVEGIVAAVATASGTTPGAAG
jgi:acyl carrier protein